MIVTVIEMSNILLIDVDSKIPNLALMKISAYHKSIGDNVGFNNIDNPTVVYASVIFKKNKHLVDGLKFYYPNSEIIIGGAGYNIGKKLPDKIENIKPDYNLYDTQYSLGYASRGCNRNCSFCIVPQKEGDSNEHNIHKNGTTNVLTKLYFLIITYC